MTVQDDLRRLSQLDSIYLGWRTENSPGEFNITCWYKGRLQQSNDGNWIFRSISSDGTIIGFQLGSANANWSSAETPSFGISVEVPITQTIALPPPTAPFTTPVAIVLLQQQLPPELTN